MTRVICQADHSYFNTYFMSNKSKINLGVRLTAKKSCGGTEIWIIVLVRGFDDIRWLPVSKCADLQHRITTVLDAI